MRTFVLSEKLPGHDVRMVFHRGNEDLITWLYERFAKARGDEVNTLCCPTCKDDLLGKMGVEEGFDAPPHSIVLGRRLAGEIVQGTVNSRILFFIKRAYRIDDAAGLVRCGCCVQIDKGFAV